MPALKASQSRKRANISIAAWLRPGIEMPVWHHRKNDHLKVGSDLSLAYVNPFRLSSTQMSANIIVDRSHIDVNMNCDIIHKVDLIEPFKHPILANPSKGEDAKP